MRTKTTATRRLAALCALSACALLGAGAAQASAAVPTVTNEGQTGVTGATATLNGTVKTDSTLSDCHFEYVDPVAVGGDTSFSDLSSGGTVNCATSDGNPIAGPGDVPADSTAHAISATIPLPAPGAPIYYRLVTTNATGTAAGSFWRGFGFGVTKFTGGVFDNSSPTPLAVTQAGARPYTASSTFTSSTTVASDHVEYSTQPPKDAIVNVPPGLVGNVQGIPQCTELQLDGPSTGVNTSCPPASQVGSVSVFDSSNTPGVPHLFATAGVYNMAPPHGSPAAFGFNVLSNVTHVVAGLRTGGDYGVTLTSLNIPQPALLTSVTFNLWGVPADTSHDSARYCVDTRTGYTRTLPCHITPTPPLTPFITLPTSCTGPVQTFLDLSSWTGGEGSSSFTTAPGGTGCNALDYSSPDNAPSLQARPTTNVADAPSGLDVDLQIPQHNGACAAGTPVSCPNAEAHLKDTVVTLPKGLVTNPSVANGLGACSESDFGYTDTGGDGTIHTTPDAATCPDAAKLGSVEVDSPLLANPLEGAVYIAKPFDNPFDSLLALYITVDDPQTGIVVKLAGEVTPDPQTGQLTATFKNNPQLPFEHFLLHFFGGSGGSLRTPAVCGDYETDSTLTPWSAPDAAPADVTDPWSITQGPNGGGCANSEDQEPHAPSLDAGTVSPVAASYTPGVITLRRDDGSQQFKTVTLSPPPGMLGKLAGIPACSEAQIAQALGRTNTGDGATEQVDPSCPAASQVGTVDVAAGAGPAPYWAKGKVYMAGPYQGAPLSFVIITPAVAGPFDLGVVTVRTALHIDPATAQITAVSDNIPDILDGVPLDVRTAAIKLDRDRFIRTGTNCDEQAFSGSLLSTLGQSAPLSQRFQLGECSGLAFKPGLRLSLKGGTLRNGHPAFTSVLTGADGQANLGKVQVTLPPTMQLDQSHIQAPCTRPQFAANQCPDASIIGTAVATSPLVDYQLSGPVYLRTGNNPLPDVVLALKGPASQPIEIDTVGKIDTVHARLRTTFETIPDAPVTRAVISLVGGGKGLLVNNTNLCAHPDIASLALTGQNNKTADSNPKVAVKCPKHKKKKHHKKHKRHHRRAHRRAVR